jgi:hypothetical protein
MLGVMFSWLWIFVSIYQSACHNLPEGLMGSKLLCQRCALAEISHKYVSGNEKQAYKVLPK